MKCFLFYDTETTGLNKAFDQILTFAAIRTDLEFHELERYTFTIKLRPDIIPSPAAVITHRIPIAATLSAPCEYESIKKIHTLFNTPETISLGYNSLRFDDELLRFSFYRNLLPPYTHQYSNGCYRMDLFPIALIYWLYKHDVISWPDKDGIPSLKLEDLSQANQLVSGRSHTAMNDVIATLELAKKFSRQNSVWSYLLGYFNKEEDFSRIEAIPTCFQSVAGIHRKAIMVSSEFGTTDEFHAPVLSIGNSESYRNQSLWLRLDLPKLQQTQTATIADTTWVSRKKYGEPGIVLPPHKRYWERMNRERAELADANLKWLRMHPTVLQDIIKYYVKFRYPEIPNLDVDAKLYALGFWSSKEQQECRRFHALSLVEKEQLISSSSKTELKHLGERILLRNYQKDYKNEPSHTYKAYLQKITSGNKKDLLLDYRGQPRTTPKKALAEIDVLRKTKKLDIEQLDLLTELEQYITQNFLP